MIPSTGFESIYAKIIGESSLLGMAQSNLLNNVERIQKVRTHTFLDNNAQTEYGISRNFGHERYYCWEDTIIDCRNCPNLVENDLLTALPEEIASTYRFKVFKQDIESRSGDILLLEPFVSVLHGKDNMRYNIRRSKKIEDFDIIRVGLFVCAGSDEDFDQGMKRIKDCENPFVMKQPMAQA